MRRTLSRRWLGGTAALLLGIAGTKALLHVVANAVYGYGYFRDELYYIACSERLALGYVDHPPLIAFVTLLARTLLGDSLVALRLLPALAGAGVAVLAGLMARRLGGGLWAQGIAALSAVVPPVYLATTNLLSTIPFDHFFWALCGYLVLRLLQADEPRLWLAVGIVLGIGGLNKHNIVLLGAGLAVGLALTPAREHLRTRWPWLGGLIALGLVLPHLIWQVAHGWPVLEFASNAATGKDVRMSPPEFLTEQVVGLHPVTLPVWLAGLGYYLFAREGRRLSRPPWRPDHGSARTLTQGVHTQACLS
jgi:4-amino-4-deoxy-L-arabinose transferase-like glycosyltransferase